MNIGFGAGKEPVETQKSCVNWYDYGWRMHDPQLARFVCLDPIADKFAHVSPYNYAENRPIDGIDLWGLQYVSYRELLQNGQRMGLYTEQEVNQFAGAHERGTIKGSMLVIASFLGIISTPDSPQKSTTPENDPTPERPEPAELKEPNEGVYEFVDTEGKDYIGESGNMDERMRQHEGSGKKAPNTKEKRTEVKGGKTQREIVETKKLDSKGGADTKSNPNPNVSNKKRPVGVEREKRLRESGTWQD